MCDILEGQIDAFVEDDEGNLDINPDILEKGDE